MPFDPDVLPVPDLGLCCLNCGYGLAGLPRHRCPECGRTFTMDEHIPPGDFPVVIFYGQELRNTPDVLVLLRRYQIPYLEILRQTEAIIGYSGALLGGARLGVIRESYFEVIDLLRRQARQEPLPPSPCTQEQAAWLCPGCGEENPGNFEVCWNCGAPLPGPEASNTR